MNFNLDPVLRDDEYWLEGHPDGPFGPYDTKAEANEGKAGLVRFYTKHIHEKPTYVPPPPKAKSEPQPEPTKPKRTRKKK